MTLILEGIMKGLLQWLYGLFWQSGEYIMNALLNVFSMDMRYFQSAVPVFHTILDIMMGAGWALLLGNLVFQAAKSMMSGLGFEGEDPRTLAARTFVFAFLLLASRQICNIGLNISAALVSALQIPDSIILPSLVESMFVIDASWLLIIIIGMIIIVQLVRFFFEVGERYVVLVVLTMTAPLAFAMGGSRNTSDIFKGWARMYGSMCLMMTLNVVFMKLIVSATVRFPTGLDVFPWLILVVALARVARKADNLIARIGLNPAITGDGLGRGFPGMLALMVGRSAVSSVIRNRGAAAGGRTAPHTASRTPKGSPSGPGGGTETKPLPAFGRRVNPSGGIPVYRHESGDTHGGPRAEFPPINGGTSHPATSAPGNRSKPSAPIVSSITQVQGKNGPTAIPRNPPISRGTGGERSASNMTQTTEKGGSLSHSTATSSRNAGNVSNKKANVQPISTRQLGNTANIQQKQQTTQSSQNAVPVDTKRRTGTQSRPGASSPIPTIPSSVSVSAASAHMSSQATARQSSKSTPPNRAAVPVSIGSQSQTPRQHTDNAAQGQSVNQGVSQPQASVNNEAPASAPPSAGRPSQAPIMRGGTLPVHTGHQTVQQQPSNTSKSQTANQGIIQPQTQKNSTPPKQAETSAQPKPPETSDGTQPKAPTAKPRATSKTKKPEPVDTGANFKKQLDKKEGGQF